MRKPPFAWAEKLGNLLGFSLRPTGRRSGRIKRGWEFLESRQALAQVAELVEGPIQGRGIGQSPSGSFPNEIVVANGIPYLSAQIASRRPLFKITESGVPEVVPYVSAENPDPNENFVVGEYREAGGVLYVSGSPSSSRIGDELWRVNASGFLELVPRQGGGDSIRPGSDSSSPANLQVLNNVLYFTANDGVNGVELWRVNSGGVAEMIEDAIPGGGINTDVNVSRLLAYDEKLISVESAVLFTAWNGGRVQLYRLNAVGNAEIVNAEGSALGIYDADDPGFEGLSSAAGYVYFSAKSAVFNSPREYWRVGPTGSAKKVQFFENGVEVPFAGLLNFSEEAAGASEVFGSAVVGSWRIGSDGLASPIAFDPPTETNVRPSLQFLAMAGGAAYFAGGTPFRSDVWRMEGDGTAKLVRPIGQDQGGINGSSSSNPTFVGVVGNTLFVSAENSVTGRELWRVRGDGVAELVDDDIPGGGIHETSSSYPAQNGGESGSVQASLFFVAQDELLGSSLWRVEETGIARQVPQVTFEGEMLDVPRLSRFRNFQNVNGRLYFGAADPASGWELWRVNDQGNSEIVESIPTGAGLNQGNSSSDPKNFVISGSTLYFTANDGYNGRELWRVTPSGRVEMVEDSLPGGGIGRGGAASIDAFANSQSFADVHGVLYFAANDGQNGVELWRINDQGLAEMVEDASPEGGIAAGAASSSPSQLTVAGGTLYFAANSGLELWRVNPTGIAERVVNAPNSPRFTMTTASRNNATPRIFESQGTIYFVANGQSVGTELWRINKQGQAELVEDETPGGGIAPGSASALFPDDGFGMFTYAEVNRALYISASFRIYRIDSDGIARWVKDTAPGQSISQTSNIRPSEFAVAGNELYFRADERGIETELWKVNTLGLLEKVLDPTSSGGNRSFSFPTGMVNVNNSLYFSSGNHLWRISPQSAPMPIDDASAENGILSNVYFCGSAPIPATPLPVVFENDVYFCSAGIIHRVGTSGIADLVETADGGLPLRFRGSQFPPLTIVQDTLYLVGDDGIQGTQLWRLNQNGKAEMVEVVDSNGQILTNSDLGPRQMKAFAEGLYFSASTFQTGTELWRLSQRSSPDAILLSSHSIPENSRIGALIGALTAVDANTEDTHVFSFAAGTGDSDNGSFQLRGNQLFVGALFNYEAKAAYSIRVRATDSSGLSVERQFQIDITDVVLAGDVDGDEVVSFRDFALLRASFGRQGATLQQGDLDGDGDVDIADFAILRANFGRRA